MPPNGRHNPPNRKSNTCPNQNLAAVRSGSCNCWARPRNLGCFCQNAYTEPAEVAAAHAKPLANQRSQTTAPHSKRQPAPHSPTLGSATPPQNHRLPGQDRLNNRHLLRPKMPQRGRRLHPLLGEMAHGRCRPTPRLFYDTTSPDTGRKCRHNHFRPTAWRSAATPCLARSLGLGTLTKCVHHIQRPANCLNPEAAYGQDAES
jgi:hypothetical protein